MGQSKLPAQCSECGAIGPARPKATSQGWWRRQPWAKREKPDWVCPKCVPAAKEAQRLEQEQRDKEWRARVRQRRIYFEEKREAEYRRSLTITKILGKCGA